MKCQEVCAALEEYFDGELDERHGQVVRAHLAACATCAEAYGALQREQDFLLRYERDVEVTPALWQGVAARIAAERTELPRTVAPDRQMGVRLRGWLAGALTVPRFSPALTAALVAVAVALTVGMMKFAQAGDAHRSVAQGPATQAGPLPASPKQDATPSAPLPQAASAPPTQDVVAANENRDKPRRVEDEKKDAVKDDKALTTSRQPRLQVAGLNTPTNQVKRAETAEDLVKDAEQKYQKAIEILARDVNQRRPRFDPVTLARFDDTLKALDRTIAETRRAALGQGNDPVAVQYMLTAYAKKVEVLREMARN